MHQNGCLDVLAQKQPPSPQKNDSFSDPSDPRSQIAPRRASVASLTLAPPRSIPSGHPSLSIRPRYRSLNTRTTEAEARRRPAAADWRGADGEADRRGDGDDDERREEA